jgi:hypothetical protein
MRKSDCVSAGVQPLVFHWQEAAGNSDQEVPGSCPELLCPCSSQSSAGHNIVAQPDSDFAFRDRSLLRCDGTLSS